jgi:hypothetical protein
LDGATAFAADKWLYFTKTLPFKDDVSFLDRIICFLPPAFEGLRKNFPALRQAPEAVLLLIVAKGIEFSGTHSRAELEAALGVPMPD